LCFFRAPLHLHTWSLPVEEQSYFIWPAILLLLSKLKSITIISILSTPLYFSPCTIYLTNADPNTAYFFTQGRFFELGIGATLAVFWHSIPLAKNGEQYTIYAIIDINSCCVLTKKVLFLV
jgi:peptidoglycan/LPS O-acetylase OafA/YrhL